MNAVLRDFGNASSSILPDVGVNCATRKCLLIMKMRAESLTRALAVLAGAGADDDQADAADEGYPAQDGGDGHGFGLLMGIWRGPMSMSFFSGVKLTPPTMKPTTPR